MVTGPEGSTQLTPNQLDAILSQFHQPYIFKVHVRSIHLTPRTALTCKKHVIIQNEQLISNKLT